MTSNTRSKPDVPKSTPSSRGLRSVGLFARWPGLGLTMLVVGGLAFGVLAYLLRTSESFLAWDMSTARMFRTMQQNAPWSWMENMLFGCFLGQEVVFLIATILAAYFLHKRFWRELAMLLFGLGGGALIWYVLGRYFDRPRPLDHLEVLPLSGPSFPSGPALVAVLCYGLLAYLLIPRLPTLFWKWFAALLLTGAVLMVASSSLLFGTHYASDMIAGLALGVAWAGVAYTLAERTFQQGADGIPDSIQPAAAFGGLRSPGLFRRRPIVALALILLASLIFAALGYSLLTDGILVQADMSVYRQLLATARVASPLVNDIMLFGFFVGKQAVQVITAVLSLYFLSQRYWREFAMLQLSSQGGGLLWNFFIDYFDRARPAEQLGFATSAIPSFPSGHALGTMICYGFLTYLLVPKMPSRFWQWTLSIAMSSLVLFEGFSRLFHGNHYLTDVLAGYALGIICVVLACTLIEGIFRNRGAEA